MEIGRRTVVVGGGAALMLTPMQGAEAADDLAAAISPDGQTIRVVRVFADGGRTMIADAVLPADPSPYPLFKQFLTHKASATALYRAPPGLRIAGKAVPAKDLVFISAGDTTLVAGKQTRHCAAGAFILIESGAACDERAGKTGFTAIKIRLAD
jgi:hypothetical protein